SVLPPIALTRASTGSCGIRLSSASQAVLPARFCTTIVALAAPVRGTAPPASAEMLEPVDGLEAHAAASVLTAARRAMRWNMEEPLVGLMLLLVCPSDQIVMTTLPFARRSESSLIASAARSSGYLFDTCGRILPSL